MGAPDGSESDGFAHVSDAPGDCGAQQHALIAQRVDLAMHGTRQDGQRAMATLIGHMRRFHEWRGNSAVLRLVDLVELHEGFHEGEVADAR